MIALLQLAQFLFPSSLVLGLMYHNSTHCTDTGDADASRLFYPFPAEMSRKHHPFAALTQRRIKVSVIPKKPYVITKTKADTVCVCLDFFFSSNGRSFHYSKSSSMGVRTDAIRT